MYDWGMTYHTNPHDDWRKLKDRVTAKNMPWFDLEINTVCEKSEREDRSYSGWWCKNYP